MIIVIINIVLYQPFIYIIYIYIIFILSSNIRIIFNVCQTLIILQLINNIIINEYILYYIRINTVGVSIILFYFIIQFRFFLLQFAVKKNK